MSAPDIPPMPALAATPDAPKRIQRKRTKGWRMPEGAIYVGRPTRWGNPFPVGMNGHVGAVQRFRAYLPTSGRMEDIPRYLRGHDLCCWCSLDQPCHADVLLEIANA